MSNDSQQPRTLIRGLGLWGALSVCIGGVIGTGIFLKPSAMFREVGSVELLFAAWIVAGILSLMGALTYAELGAMRPETSGEYVYIKDAYGPLAGFIYSWATFVVAKPASIASLGTGMATFAAAFGPLSGLSNKIVETPFSLSGIQVLSAAAIVVISAINYVGVRAAGAFQVIFTVLKVAGIGVIICIAFSASVGSFGHFGMSYAAATGGIAGFFAAVVAALWAYDGWNFVTHVGGEIKNPQRNIPISLILGMAVIAFLYLSANIAYLYVLTPTQIALSTRVAADSALVAIGGGAMAVISVITIISSTGALNGSVLTGARVPYAAARDGYFFKRIATVHPRFLTPSSAIVFQAVFSVALSLTGTFDRLTDLAVFWLWVFYVLTTSTIFLYRRREPSTPRPYRTWGYPVVPALFCVVGAVMLVYTFHQGLTRSMMADSLNVPAGSLLHFWLSDSVVGLAVVLAGIPFYVVYRRLSRQSAAGSRQ